MEINSNWFSRNGEIITGPTFPKPSPNRKSPEPPLFVFAATELSISNDPPSQNGWHSLDDRDFFHAQNRPKKPMKFKS